MKKNSKLLKNITKEIVDHKVIYLALFLISVFGFFLRIYRLSNLMGFYYDQGRDALVIWKFLHEGKPFLIGPVTGLSGIFLGPLYYFLITPFYFLGRGNPLYPAIFLTFLTTLALPVVYYLGWKFYSRAAGLIAASISAFSYYLIMPSRWLSNPTPMFLTSVLFLLSLWKIIQGGDRRWWIVTAALLGISLQFESASAVFYIPVTLFFIFWQRQNLPGKKIAFISALLLFSTFIPQILFNFRHDNLLLNNFYRVIVREKSFRLDIWTVIITRIKYFWTVFYSKIFPTSEGLAGLFGITSFLILLKNPELFDKTKALKILSLFIGIPMLGYILFQGNFGHIYDYYMTGYYLPIILLFSLGLAVLWQSKPGKVIVFIFFVLFLIVSGGELIKYYRRDIHESTNVSLGNQVEAVDWILEKGKGIGQYNVEIYVPPVIPYSYDYLFLWRKTLLCKESCGYVEELRSILYSLYEIDQESPERLDAWLSNQNRVSRVIDEIRFGGIIVQKRQRN